MRRTALAAQTVMHGPAASWGPGVVHVTGDRITGVERSLGAVGSDTEVLDFGDRFICPGFIDVHAHFEVAARTVHGTVDCRVPGCATIADVVERLGDAAASWDSERWLVGQGNLFFDQKLAERRLPTRAELDEASTDVPIALRAGGHVTVLNSRGLQNAGIDRDFEPAAYSVTGLPVVERDAAGEPTGVVKEMDKLLGFPDAGGPELREALREGAMTLFTRHGVTTVGEISETVQGLETMGSLLHDGEMGLNVAAYLWSPGTLPLEQACAWEQHLSLQASAQRMWVQGLKLFADGGFTAAGAAVKRPYAIAPDSCGHLALAPTDVRRATELAARAGMQLAVHANGERAQELLCAELIGAPRDWRVPVRVEHAGNFVPDWTLTDAWREAGIIAVPQPGFLYAIGDFMPAYVGEYGRTGQFPLRRLIDEGWRLSGSSDVWIGSEQQQTNPLFGMWCAVARTGFEGLPIEPEQAISVEEALGLYTSDAAATLGEQHRRGAIEEGLIADVVVLERDPRSVGVDELPGINVDCVVVGGRVVHQREGARDPERTYVAP
jgi:predicted amidohydrolase YtcJ